jgi:hypothetical protein
MTRGSLAEVVTHGATADHSSPLGMVCGGSFQFRIYGSHQKAPHRCSSRDGAGVRAGNSQFAFYSVARAESSMTREILGILGLRRGGEVETVLAPKSEPRIMTKRRYLRV